MSSSLLRRAMGVALVGAALLAAPARSARADEEARIAELAETMGKGHSERERIAAVTALARLGSKSTLRPLVTALSDASPTVRGVAAAGLARLGHRAALPALRNVAAHDSDALVRKRATEAVAQVSAANGIAMPSAAPVAKAGFGNKPRAVAPRPEVYMIVKSTRDDSPGRHDVKARKVHAELLRDCMRTEMAGVSYLTATAADARRFGLDPRNVDVSIVALETREAGRFVEVEAQLRLAISDDRGKMLSFLSGGAKVQVPRRSYSPNVLPQLRKEALENAVRGLFGKLVDHLRRGARS